MFVLMGFLLLWMTTNKSMFDYKNFKGFLDPRMDASQLRSKNGRRFTAALFLETAIADYTTDVPAPLYTLRESEARGLPSAYCIYISSTDEYEAAMKLVGSMAHWDILCKAPWFMGEPEGLAQYPNLMGFDFPGLNAWRRDMALRDNSYAKRQLMDHAAAGDVGAARKLLDESNHALHGKRDVGRPKRAKKGEEASPGDEQNMSRAQKIMDAAKERQGDAATQ